MTLEIGLALAVAALLGCWMIGAYNRLVVLRNAIAAAWGKVVELVQQREAAAVPLLAALQTPLAAEHGALQAVQQALATQRHKAAAMSAKPVDEAAAGAWLAAELQLAAATSRLFALLALADDGARNDPAVAQGAAAWRNADERLPLARAMVNDAVSEYNAAVELFPTRLLLPLFSFGRAGRV